MRLIGFAGPATSGKTTCAEALDCTLLPFAGPIRCALGELGITKHDHPKLYRELAQVAGATIRRANPAHFVDLMRDAIAEYSTEVGVVNGTIAIDDVRYPNEIDLIHELGGRVVFVYNPSVDITLPMYRHESEVMGVELHKMFRDDGTIWWRTVNGVLINDSTAEDIERRARELAVSLF